MAPTGDSKAERQPKHTAIMGVTDKVLQQISRLEALVAEISPHPQPEEIKVDKKLSTPSSLSDFLNNEAERLDLAASRIGEATSELKNLLF